MKLEEAQTYLSIMVEVKHRIGKEKEAKAIQLGLEALKAVKDLRNAGLWPLAKILPNETDT